MFIFVAHELRKKNRCERVFRNFTNVNLTGSIVFFQDRVCEIILPRLQKRSVLEENGQLKPRWSALEEDLEAIVAEEEANKIVSASQNLQNATFLLQHFLCGIIQSADLNTGDGYESPVPSPPRKEKKKKEKKDKKDKKEKKKKKYKDLDAPDGSRR